MLKQCPACNFRFALTYSRTFTCQGCPSSYMGDCGLVKCPKCGKEFPSK